MTFFMVIGILKNLDDLEEEVNFRAVKPFERRITKIIYQFLASCKCQPFCSVPNQNIFYVDTEK